MVTEIAWEILVRFPVKSLLRFKCACKNRYALIKTPEFVQQHLNCSKSKPPQFLISDYGAPDDDDDDDVDSHSVTFISDNGVSLLPPDPQRFNGVRKIVGSVDGLFFIVRETDHKVFSYAL
ncbi:hypothetical protein P3S67_011552 [Capsicum chacoense]